ncbi:MBL fold metallo-hydrolase [Rubellimicrobium arenae]|uniref:MBL fold metallo-hydrolase n=1 Tax=Rubellimicrobium arenae TaxID=2817372 RepID=UPI001B30095B|nr:MBL fold metallo-hydrolase [Rubellimicrobium arenae]
MPGTERERVSELEPGLVRVRAANASPLTADGTNTYLLGHDELCVIDPGPEDPSHLARVLDVIGRRPVRAIAVTHAHLDHSGLSRALAARTGAPVLAFGDARAGQRPAPDGLASGPGVDQTFRPDGLLRDGEILEGAGWRIVARHTPGHMGNHLSFDDGRHLFSGDHAMGFATSVVSPPEGHMGDYLDSLERLIRIGPRVLLPGHGDSVADGLARLGELLAHRLRREAQILDVLASGPASPAEIAERLYTGLAPDLRPAARRNVLAHLIALVDRNRVTSDDSVSEMATFRRV